MLAAKLIAVLFVLRLVWHAWRRHRKINTLGGYARHSATNNFVLGLDFIWDSIKSSSKNEDLIRFPRLLNEKGHTLEMSILGERIIITDEPENIKALLSSQFSDYGKGEKFRKLWDPVLGESIFAADGEKWQNQRELLRSLVCDLREPVDCRTGKKILT